MAARQATSSSMALAALFVVLGSATGWLHQPNFMVFPTSPLMGEARRGDALLTPSSKSVMRPASVAPQSSCFLVALGAVAAAGAAAVRAARAPGQRKKAGASRLLAVQLKAKADEKEEEYDSDEDEEEDDEEDGLLYDEDDDDDLYIDEDKGPRPYARCRARHLRGSPQKFRRVLWQIRGRSYREALMILEFMPWRQCKPTLCALQSAAANAQNHLNMDKSRLYISMCKADDGPTSRRMKPISKGQSHPFKKRSTHLEIRVAEMTDAELAKNQTF